MKRIFREHTAPALCAGIAAVALCLIVAAQFASSQDQEQTGQSSSSGAADLKARGLAPLFLSWACL